MARFEDNLDARISETLNEAKLSDEMYKKYVQFVGALDALPPDQIATDWKTSDIHDQFGRVRPFSQWPTKSSRTKSEKVWLNYNQRLQLQQAAKEGGLEQEDPTADPDFLAQMLDTCVRTSMKMGKLDRNTAFRHCSRQVQRFEQAVRGALADRGLTSRQIEEFTKELLRGMANGKSVDIKDLSIEDQQFIQDLKDSLTYKPRSEDVVREDLDDQDEFRHAGCVISGCDEKPPGFHDAHENAAVVATAEAKPYRYQWKLYGKAYDAAYVREMKNHGWRYDSLLVPYGYVGKLWVPVKEDLDDQDKFAPECTYDDCDRRPDSEQFHQAHTEATKEVFSREPKGHEKFGDMMAMAMAKFGYSPVKRGYMVHWVAKPVTEDVEHPTPTIILPNMKSIGVGDWIEWGPPAKPTKSGEGLDDTDEFSHQDFPPTPVQIVSVDELSSKHWAPGTLRVRLSNYNLLSLPDKSGVRWHGRPREDEPAWYEPWHGNFYSVDLENAFSDGNLRVIDNIEEWFQAQPEN